MPPEPPLPERGEIYRWRGAAPGLVARVEVVRESRKWGHVVFFMRKGESGYEVFDALPVAEWRASVGECERRAKS